MNETAQIQPQLAAVRKLAELRSDVKCEEDYGYFIVGSEYGPCVQGYWDVEGSPLVAGNGIRLIARGKYGQQVARFEFFDDDISAERLASLIKIMLQF